MMMGNLVVTSIIQPYIQKIIEQHRLAGESGPRDTPTPREFIRWQLAI